jgi:exodeoxyribonuclease VII large subunit
MEIRYVSVHSLNQYIKARFLQDTQLQNIYIKGEVSNYRPHPSGHLYFTLKDDTSRISAVMFASAAKKMNFQLENGMQVLIHGKVAVYEVNGAYQLYVTSMKQDGIGNLFLQYQLLKEKLEKEGLFDQKYKKEIPKFPHRVAVLSAKQGAAVQDVVRTIKLRAPFVNVVVFPIPVQGENAYQTIIRVLKNVDKLNFNTIILARGGGSLEDLMNFNNELLARTIFDLKTPIISGIGHETDFTICDFVSDFRAVTPTGAAIKATPDCKELRKYNDHLKKLLNSCMIKRIDIEKNNLSRLSHSYLLENPEQLYIQQILKVTKLEDHLVNQFKIFEQNHIQQQNFLTKKLFDSINNSLNKKSYQLSLSIEKLDALSPLKVLYRGYSLVYKNHTMIKSIHDVNENDDIDIQMNDGIVKAKVGDTIGK